MAEPQLPTHQFWQDPDATQVAVCVCGRWPSHPIHATWQPPDLYWDEPGQCQRCGNAASLMVPATQRAYPVQWWPQGWYHWPCLILCEIGHTL